MRAISSMPLVLSRGLKVTLCQNVQQKILQNKTQQSIVGSGPVFYFLKDCSCGFASEAMPPFLSRCQKRYCVTSAFASCCGVLNVCLYVECNFLVVKIWKASLILVTIGKLHVGNLTVWGWRRET